MARKSVYALILTLFLAVPASAQTDSTQEKQTSTASKAKVSQTTAPSDDGPKRASGISLMSLNLRDLPAFATLACEPTVEGRNCQYYHNKSTVKGTCELVEGTLACVPYDE